MYSNQYVSGNYSYVDPYMYRDNYNLQPKFVIASEGFSKGNLERNSYKPYKNYIPRTPSPLNEKAKKLLEYQMNAFAAHEANLYLDVCPEDKEVLKAYVYYRKETERLLNEYERSYGPLKVCSSMSEVYPWSWVNDPWPWEGVM